MLLVAGRDLWAGDDLDRLAERLQLVFADLLVLRKHSGLCLESSLDLSEHCLVRRLLLLCACQLPQSFGRCGRCLGLDGGLGSPVRSGLLDRVAQVHRLQIVVVRPVGLILFHVTEFRLELVQELLQQLQDAIGLEVVCGDRRRALTACLILEEDGQDAVHARGGLRHLLEEGLGLWAVVGLGGDDLDGPLQGIHRLGVVLLELHILCMLGLTDVCRVLLFALHPADVRVEVGDLIAEGGHLVVGLLDERSQLLNAALASLDLEPQLLRAVVSPLLVLRKGLALCLRGNLRLAGHLGQGIEDLLHGRDAHARGGRKRPSGEEGQEHHGVRAGATRRHLR
mmetsp:Transcript_17059/g.46211  ORF Transcript_17059/g.46211 Transcript_17059/m.46211 type:complete len:339 (+) Transcript_17059:1101-2117(+)